MKKALLLLHIFLWCMVISYAQSKYPFEENEYYFNAYYDDLASPPFIFSFKEDVFSMDIPELNLVKLENGESIKGTIKGKYTLSQKDDFLYLAVSDKKYLILYQSDLICILINCANNNSFFGMNSKSPYAKVDERRSRNMVGINGGMAGYIKTSSFLTETISEKEIQYNNLHTYYFQLTLPWVEGKSGYGIGEWIEKRIFFETDELVFFNGVINPNRPDLFFANARIKEVEIISGTQSWKFPLADTPNPQIITLPQKISGIIRFVIADVYSGKRYQDTALAGIYFLQKKYKEQLQ